MLANKTPLHITVALVQPFIVVTALTGLFRASVLAERPGLAGNDYFAVNGPTYSHAKAVLERASELRDEIALHWFGSPLPDSEPITVIHVKDSTTIDEGLTWLADRLETKGHFIWLTTDARRALGPTLAHEIAHVCLAWRFPEGMPAWANEGIASSYDDENRKSKRKEFLLKCARGRSWPRVASVLDARGIHPTDVDAYAVSASLVEFLLEKGSREELLKFVEHGKRQDWNEALRKYYRMDGVAQLQQLWQTWVITRFGVPESRS